MKDEYYELLEETANWTCTQAWEFNNRAHALMELGRYDEALRDFDRACKMDPAKPYLPNNRGQALMELGRYKEALRDFDRACKMDPTDRAPLLNAAELFYRLGMKERALEHLGKVRQLAGDGDVTVPRELCYLAETFLRHDDSESAEEALIAYLRFSLSIIPYTVKDDRNSYIIRKDGHTIDVAPNIVDFDDLDRIIGAINWAKKRNCATRQIKDLLGKVKAYDRACSLDQDDASFLVNRSGLLLELGMRERVVEGLGKARLLSGNGDVANPRHLSHIAQMFVRCNETDLAEEALLAFLQFVLSVLPYAAREEDDAGISHIIGKDGLAIQMCPGIMEPDDLDSSANMIVNENGGKNASRFDRLLKEVRQGIQALGNIKDRHHIEPLIGMLDDISPYVRCTAAWALGAIGDSRMVEPLIGMLHDTSADVRYEAASALGRVRDSRSVKHLIPLLEDDDSNVRSCTARILSGMEDLQLSQSIAALVASCVSKWTWKNPVKKNKTKRDIWNAGVRTVYSRIGL